MCDDRTKSPALVGSAAVRRRRESGLALGLLLGAALLLGASLPGADAASPGKLHERQAALAGRSHAALLSLYALDSRLARARSELTALQGREDALRAEQDRVRRAAAVVEGNLRVSQRLLGDRLRALYEEGEPDAIAVLLGATSLDDAVTRLDELERSARLGAQAATDARDGRTKLRGLALELAARVREIQTLSDQVRRTTSALGAARERRVAYLAALARQSRLTKRQVQKLDSHAQRVVEKAQQVQASAQNGAGATSAAPSVAEGAKTLTVTATGYSLPGHTATGLPVGPGIVAVDPSVIPLGTRLTIPGYGEGVAADTGGAVQGLTIDLWFPTLADALAWGRRTLTITLH
jgi:3D (Asp-Asp-Asp) domain-containing protein